jgi:hypothetical protein
LFNKEKYQVKCGIFIGEAIIDMLQGFSNFFVKALNPVGVIQHMAQLNCSRAIHVCPNFVILTMPE